MKQSKIVVSPFGWGEINNRDFEAFIYGCLLIKPTLNCLETYPNYFKENITYLSYGWDHADMQAVIQEAKHNYEKYLDVAMEGQEFYIKHTLSRHGREGFVNYFSELVDDVLKT